MLMLFKTFKVGLRVDDARDQMFRHRFFQFFLIDCLINHKAVLSLSSALFYWNFVRGVFAVRRLPSRLLNVFNLRDVIFTINL